MERITVTITADTHDRGAQVLEHLGEWLSQIDTAITVGIAVEEKASSRMWREVDEFAARLRSEGV